MTVIAISNLKGGTGKTTSAILLATAFHRHGRSVTVVDLDPQGSATEWAQMAEDAGEPLAFPVTLGNVHTTKNLRETTDFTILDCPPGNPTLIDTAIAAADVVIVPVQPSGIETERMWDTIDIAGKDKAVVLLTSVLLSAKSTGALKEALQEDNIKTFRGAIPRREEIRRWYGSTPTGTLHGYESIAEQIVEAERV
ncbi:ParA family protein [Corynebacterium senegalense]|uniref:ParA family protein n=1 Tax=Corynebacterium senegalense TaxID=2080750 RepID=UPI000E1FF481|nr:ParA family protein [Corynebacterium senegalense]